jgi:hypothetical protein
MMEIEIPFAPMATIYRSPRFIVIETISGSSALHHREDKAFRTYLEPGAANEILGKTLLAALDRSRLFNPFSEREFYDGNRVMRAENNWEKEFMSRYGYKTKRDAYKDLDWCYVKRDAGKISIQPHRRYKINAWKRLPADRTVIIPDIRDDDAVGAAVRLALDRCE